MKMRVVSVLLVQMGLLALFAGVDAEQLAAWSEESLSGGFSVHPRWNVSVAGPGVDASNSFAQLDGRLTNTTYYSHPYFMTYYLQNTGQMQEDRYIQVFLAPRNGAELALGSISFNVYSSRNGAKKAAVRFSADQFSANLVEVNLLPSTHNCVRIGLEDFPEMNSISQSVEFRLYLWDSQGAQVGVLTDAPDRTPAIEICGTVNNTESLQTNDVVRAAKAVLERNFGSFADRVLLKWKEGTGRDSSTAFQFESTNGVLTVWGETSLALCSGVNWYLKHYANSQVCRITGVNNLPDSLPDVSFEEHVSPYHYVSMYNYCTFGYSMPWWDWSRWEQEIDWMALNGVNLPLAMVGAEAVWIHTLERFGYTHDEAKEYVCGPAHLPWFLMGNLEEVGGPLPESWINQRIELQKKIIARMHELGMSPVLQGYVGLVPTTFSERYPDAPITHQGQWFGMERPSVLDPRSELFKEIAAVWYEESEKLFGSVKYYAGDLFHEGGIRKGADLKKYAEAIQGAMLAANPDSVWELQGWGNNPSGYLLEGCDPSHTLIVSLGEDYFRNWEKRKGFGKFPWVWTYILNYGGNVGLHGRLDWIAEEPPFVLENENAGTFLKGIGQTSEGTLCNPVVNDLFSDMVWRKTAPDMANWLDGYICRRYGQILPAAQKAWKLLYHSSYGSYGQQGNREGNRRTPESIFCARPRLSPPLCGASLPGRLRRYYDARMTAQAARLLYECSDRYSHSDAYRYDLVDVTRQALCDFALTLFGDMSRAIDEKNDVEFEKNSGLFLELLSDQDRLLKTRDEFLLGRWIDDARSWGKDSREQEFFEYNARMLVTTWYPFKGILNDYSHREWSGLLDGFYRKRWELFQSWGVAKIRGENPPDPDYVAFELGWLKGRETYPSVASGDEIQEVGRVLDRWKTLLIDVPQPFYRARSSNDFCGAWYYRDKTGERLLYCADFQPDGMLVVHAEELGSVQKFKWKYEEEDGSAIVYDNEGQEVERCYLGGHNTLLFSVASKGPATRKAEDQRW